MGKRQSKVFWIEMDEDGNLGMGPRKDACDHFMYKEIAPPKMKPGEKLKVRLVVVERAKVRDEAVGP